MAKKDKPSDSFKPIVRPTRKPKAKPEKKQEQELLSSSEDEVVMEVPILIKIKDFIYERYCLRHNLLIMDLEYKRKAGKGGEVWELLNHRTKKDMWIDLALGGVRNGRSNVGMAIIETIIESSRYTPDYHPLKEYLKNLEWDGKDWIAEWCSCAKLTEDPDTFLEGKPQSEIFNLMMYRWFANAAAIVLGKTAATNSHVMLVLEGSQGKGKSGFLDSLCPPDLIDFRFSGAIIPDISANPTANLLAEKFIVHIDDQLHKIQGKDFTSVKNIITAVDITNRKEYNKHSKRRQRVASFVASVNGRKIFMDTENRRYMVFSLSSKPGLAVDFERLNKVDMNQCWAQAMALVSKGYLYSTREQEMIQKMNIRYNQATPEEEWLLRCYEPVDISATGADVDDIQITEILSTLRKVSGLNMYLNRLNMAADRIGFVFKQRRSPQYGNVPRDICRVRRLWYEPSPGSYFFKSPHEQTTEQKVIINEGDAPY